MSVLSIELSGKIKSNDRGSVLFLPARTLQSSLSQEESGGTERALQPPFG